MKHLLEKGKIKKSVLVLAGVTILLMAGCTNSYYLKPITRPNDNIEVVYFRGAPMAVSYGKEAVVMLSGLATTTGTIGGNELALRIFVKNLSPKRVDVIPENIVVYGFGSQLQKEYLKVHTAEGYLKKIRRKQNWLLAAQALSGAMEAEEAAKSTSSTSGYVSGSGGTIYGHATTETYDGSKKAEAIARNAAALERTQQQNALTDARLQVNLLKCTTLFQDQCVLGTVMIRFRKCSGELIIKVPIGKEVHTFVFSSAKP